MTPDRTVTWTRPDGTIWITHHPSTDNPTNNDNDNEIGCLTPATPHHTLPSARARGSPSVPYRR